MLDAVGEREILAVICTHGHTAHVAAAVEVAQRDESPVALHAADRVSWHLAHRDDTPDIEVEDGGRFDVADVGLEVLHAPGHTPGSICLYCEELDAVFTGDVLHADGPVPHDEEFPDFPRQLSSIGERVLTLPTTTRVLPGHGPELTVGAADKNFDSWATAGRRGCWPPAMAGGRAGSRDWRGSSRGVADGLAVAGPGEGRRDGKRAADGTARVRGHAPPPVRVHADPADDLAGLPAPVPHDLPGPAPAAQGAAVGAQQRRRQRAQRAGGLVAAAPAAAGP